MKWKGQRRPGQFRVGEDSRSVIAGAALTLILHLGIIWTLTPGASRLDDDEDIDPMIVETELLKWGEVEPDDKALPNIANPRPADPRNVSDARPEETQAPAEEAVVLNADEKKDGESNEQQKKADDQERKADVADATYRGETNPHRPTNDIPIEGFGDGFKGGTSLSPSAQRNMLAQIQEQLQKAFSPPRSLSEDALKKLSIHVHIRIAPDGQILKWQVEAPSGNRQFDTAALTTLNRFRNGKDRLDMNSITDPGFRSLIEAKGLPIVMVGQ